MTYLIRSATLTNYPEVARAAGLDPGKMLIKARLSPRCFDRPDMRIPVIGVRRLLELSAKESGIEEFGLRMADKGMLPNLGPLALIVREQATIGEALQALARYLHVHHEGMRLSIGPHGGVVTLTLTLRGGIPPAPRQSFDMALGSLHRVIQSLAGHSWRPIETHLAYPPPRNRKYYREFFGCPVMFQGESNSLLISSRDLDREIPLSHPMIARYVQDRVDAIGKRRQSWDGKVSEAVRKLLPSGDCSVDRVAEHFACDRRTIHRRLAQCGTTFSEIVATERAELALRLIEERNQPLSEIARMVGFSAQSSMARWFKERFGCSISAWRSGDGKLRRSARSRLAADR
jgi:AraC-like DNA-binding protein